MVGNEGGWVFHTSTCLSNTPQLGGIGGLPGGGGGGGGGSGTIGITPQSIKSFIESIAKSVYCALAPHPGATLQASATGSLSGFGVGYAGGYTAAIDNTGSIELFRTDGGYRSLGVGGGLALTGGASTAKNVGDLAGPFLTGSATATEVGGATATVFAGTSPDGPVVGGEAGLDLGFQDSVMVGISNSTPVAGVSCP